MVLPWQESEEKEKKKRMKTFHPLTLIKLKCYEEKEEDNNNNNNKSLKSSDSNNFLQKHNYVHLQLLYFLFT
jgi:hypothetical protein